jgi:hypothetical protein
MDCLSTQPAPLLALTLSHASHTSRFGILKGLSCSSGMLTRFLPGHRPVDRVSRSKDEPAPSLHPPLQGFHRYYEPVRQRTRNLSWLTILGSGLARRCDLCVPGSWELDLHTYMKRRVKALQLPRVVPASLWVFVTGWVRVWGRANLGSWH